MTSCDIYPTVPSARPEDPQAAYHLNVIQSKREGLIKLENRYKTLNGLVWLNACSSVISVASGISSVATLSAFIGLPVSIAF